MYSSPVTWRQLPGSLPVTRSLRPSRVPVTWPPRWVVVTPTLSGDAFAPDGRCGEVLEVPVVARPAPASIQVIREGRSMLLPLTWRPLPVRVVVTLAGAGCGAVRQNSLTWPAGRYSLPETLVLRPTSVPGTGRPAAVFVSDTLLGLGTMSVWKNSRKISAARYSVPVMTRQLLSSSPVRRWPRPTCVPVTVWPWAV